MQFIKRESFLLPVSLLFAGGPALCWQQDVAYDIKAALETETHTLEGRELLTYRNNSPDTLAHLWIHLYPNAYRDRETDYAKETETMYSYSFSFASRDERGHIEILSVFSDGHPLVYTIEGTNMRIELARPLEPGGEVILEIESHLKFPKIFSRLGYEGDHYEVTQWYPKPAVYDEHGWHPDGYYALGEFYGEFGTYDVWITLPERMVVGATGTLLEPSEEIAWMERLAAGERLERGMGRKTLHFRAENVHDFAWVADPDYRLVKGSQDETAIYVLYLPKHERAWRGVLDYAREALKFYGDWYAKYPYPTLTVADGLLRAGGGMEYPNLVICSAESPSVMRLLELVVVHEIGHQWFYGLLGSDELNEAWLDEGMNTFSELRYMETKYGREGNFFNWPSRFGFMPSIGDRWLHQLSYRIATTNRAEKPVLTPAHRFVPEPIAYQAAAYSKPAFVMEMLEDLLGRETFDQVMKAYVERYSYKHPHTEDFIRVAEEVSGLELDWFFDQWLRTTEVCDYAIASLKTNRGKTEVAVERRGGIVMPVDVLVETDDGERQTQRWNGKGRRKILTFETKRRVRYALLDPAQRLLDVDRWNDRGPRKRTIHPVFSFPSFDSYQVFYGPLVGLNSVDGVRLGGFLHGREFLDYEFLKGAHNWELSFSSGLRTGRWFYNLSYRTPLYFSKNRVRAHVELSDFLGESRDHFGLSIRLGKRVFPPPEHRISLGVTLVDLWTSDYVDARDYLTGQTYSGSVSYSYEFSKRNISGGCQLSLSSARRVLGGDWSFDKLSLESVQQLKATKSLKLRLRAFLGGAFGETPPQEEFSLSGGVRPTGLSTLFISRRGTWSPQERWHIEGDGNLRGYFGRHIHDRVIACLNMELPLVKIPKTKAQSLLFYDIGNCWDDLDSVGLSLLSDLGLSLSLGPVNLAFPLWISHPREDERKFAFRWIVGLRESFGSALGG